MLDKKARQILFDTYWSGNGWKQNSTTTPEDFAYARSVGYMFDSLSLTHDEVMQWVERSIKSVNLKDITSAFLASLSTRRLDLRSALGSYAVVLHYPQHEFQGSNNCIICGVFKESHLARDLNQLNFERHKWAGVRHQYPEYIAFDLECFARLERVSPTKEDLDIMRQILTIVQHCENNARPNDLEQRLTKILKSNKEERKVLIQILAYCGILQPREYPSFFEKFVNYSNRVIPSVHKIDWTYPICWWRGIDGINQEALAYYFPQLG